MLTPTQEKFFVLLRAGLWDKPVDTQELGTDVDWKEIYKIAREQTVVGLIADAITTLPGESMPPLPVKQRFIMDKLAIEKSHIKLNAVLNEVIQVLNAHNIPHVLLKGQGVAQNYPHPTCRTCGDIDLYVGEENYKKAYTIINNMYAKQNLNKIQENSIHASCVVKGIEVEIHKFSAILISKSANKKFQKHTKEELDKNWEKNDIDSTLIKWENDGQTIYLAPAIYDVNFLIIHMYKHLIAGGIGFRQICDWTRYIYTNQNNIDEKILSEYIKQFELETIWNGFSTIITTKLGMNKNIIPYNYNHNEKLCIKLLKIIFNTGNFGKYDKKSAKAQDSNYLIHKWKRFWFHISYYINEFPIFPKAVIGYTSIWFWNGIKTILHRK